MSDSEDQGVREIRIDPIVPTQSVLVATARGMRPKKDEDRIDRARVDSHPMHLRDGRRWKIEQDASVDQK